MSDYPEAWVTAATEALRENGTHYNSILHAEKVVALVLDAVAPTIRADAERSNYEYDLLHGEHMRLCDGIRALADATGSAFPYVQVRELRALLDREEAQ